MRTNELILYRYMEHEDLLRDMTFLIDNADNDYYNKEDLKSLLFENLNELIELAANYGFEGETATFSHCHVRSSVFFSGFMVNFIFPTSCMSSSHGG